MTALALPSRPRDLTGSPAGLIGAFVASLAIHLVGAGMLGVLPSFSGVADRRLLTDKSLASEPDARDPDGADDSDRVRPGSPESSATSITWIGYEEYAPHAATSGEVDQPQLTLDPPGGPPVETALAAAPPSMPAAESARADRAEARPAPSQPPAGAGSAVQSEAEPPTVLTDPLGQPAAPPPEAQANPAGDSAPPPESNPPPRSLVTVPEGPEPSTGIGPPSTEIGPDPVFGPTPEPPAQTAASPPADLPPEPAPPEPLAPQPTAPGPPTPSPTPPAVTRPTEATPESTPAATASVPSQAPAAPGGDQAGREADRESDAASIIHVPEAKLGQPLVGKGLEIRTVRPRFSHHTILTAKPSDPVFRVLFDRDGRVTDVEILRSSGVQDVDRPLLDAVFQRARRGEQLKKLRPGTPRETVAMEFRILL